MVRDAHFVALKYHLVPAIIREVHCSESQIRAVIYVATATASQDHIATIRPVALANLIVRVTSSGENFRFVAIRILESCFVSLHHASVRWVMLQDCNCRGWRHARTLVHVRFAFALFLIEEILDVVVASAIFARLACPSITTIATEGACVNSVRVKTNDFQVDLRNQVVPIVVWNPKVFCSCWPTCRVELVASFSTSTAWVRVAVVMITINSEPGDVGQRSVDVLPLVCVLIVAVVLIQASVVEVVAPCQDKE